MKQLLASLLILSVCMACVGCMAPSSPSSTPAPGQTGSAPSFSEDPEIQAAMQEISAAQPGQFSDSSIGCLVVKINPKFELYFDAQEKVEKVVCLNGEAEALLGDEALMGLPMADALLRALILAREAGYLTAQKRQIYLAFFLAPQAQQFPVAQLLDGVCAAFEAQTNMIPALYCNILEAQVEAPQPTENSGSNAIMEELSAAQPGQFSDSSIGCLVVKINPKFELYFDAQEKVEKVVCLNSEAESLLEAENLTGQPIAAAFLRALELAQEKGYLTGEKNRVYLACFQKPQAHQFALEQVIDTVCAAFEAKTGIFPAVTCAVLEVPEEVPPPTTEPTAPSQPGDSTNPTQPSTPPVQPSNPKATYPYQHTNMNNGVTVQLKYDEIGNITHRTETYPDGTFLEMRYNTDGSFAYFHGRFPNGAEIESVYGNNGKLVSERITYTDSIAWSMERTYNSNGRVKDVTVSPQSELIQQPAITPDGATGECWALGPIIFEYAVSSKGDYSEFVTCSGAFRHDYNRMTDGSYKSNYYDNDRNHLHGKQRYIDSAFGGIHETTFYSDGLMDAYIYNPKHPELGVGYILHDKNGKELDRKQVS